MIGMHGRCSGIRPEQADRKLLYKQVSWEGGEAEIEESLE